MFGENNPYQTNFSPYSSNYLKEMEALKEENKRLKEAQMQMSDPLYVEFQNTPEYQQAKKDNVLTFLFANVFPQWQQSELGKQFVEWERKTLEAYKANRIAQMNNAATVTASVPTFTTPKPNPQPKPNPVNFIPNNNPSAPV